MSQTRAQQIIAFYQSLHLDDTELPENVAVMNPYANASAEAMRLVKEFHQKYFNDFHPRKLIVGINPGRHGAGVTGIPFTDTPALVNHCNLNTSLQTRETSATFVYEVIAAYGGPVNFYRKWFIGGVCPLGFLVKNQKKNWVNWNYYDELSLQKKLSPFILEKLKKQHSICGKPKECVVLGTGKNYKFLKTLNKQEKLFDSIIPLEHPRYIMQYKLKQKQDYIDKFLRVIEA
jgi:hypothetical protein